MSLFVKRVKIIIDNFNQKDVVQNLASYSKIYMFSFLEIDLEHTTRTR